MECDDLPRSLRKRGQPGQSLTGDLDLHIIMAVGEQLLEVRTGLELLLWEPVDIVIKTWGDLNTFSLRNEPSDL